MSFLASTLQIFSTRILLILLTAVSGILTARVLGPKGLGAFSLVLLLRSTAFRFCNFGIPSAQGYYAAKRLKSLWTLTWTGMVYGLLLSLLATLVLFLTKDFSFSPCHFIGNDQIFLAMLMLVVYFWENNFSRILMSSFEVTKVNIAELSRGGLFIVFMMAVFFIDFDRLTLVIIASLLSDLLLVVYFFIVISRLSKKYKAEDTINIPTSNSMPYTRKFFLDYCLWNYIISLLQFFKSSIGRFFFAGFKDLSLLGQYSCGESIIAKTEFFSRPLSEMLFPYNAHVPERDANMRTARLVRMMIPILAVSALACSVFIKFLIVLLYGEAFAPSAVIFRYLSPCIVAYPLSRIMSIHFTSVGKPRNAGMVSLVGLIVTATLCMFFFHKPYTTPAISLCISGGALSDLLLMSIYFSFVSKIPLKDILLFKKEDFLMLEKSFKEVSGKLWKKARKK